MSDAADLRAAGELQHLLANGRTFAVENESFILVDETHWRTLDAGAGGLRQRACGSLVVGGERFVVFSAEPARVPAGALTEVLTRRELEIAWRIAGGASNKDIGRALGISHFTVREHVRRICHKLGVRSRSCIAATVGAVGFAPTGRPPRTFLQDLPDLKG